MANKPRHRYSVYEVGTDRPICIYGTAQECADALGIDRNSFYRKLTRAKKGKAPQQHEIFIDDTDDEEDTLS